MSRKDAINSMFLKKSAPPASVPNARNPERVRTGAISAMGSSLQELTKGARAAAQLEEQLKTGDHVVTIEPNLIDASPIADRLPSAHDSGFDQLRESIREHGQQVPILVRPSPVDKGRYQIAYGRRRLRVAAELGQKVRAIIRSLSDDELVVAQGRENLDRADLSFIEKALFAKHLEDAGYERATIIAALSTDKSDLSRYIMVARQIPEELARRIGPAGKIGRARWTALAEALSSSRTVDKLAPVLKSDEFESADSDRRFGLIFAAAIPSAPKSSRQQSWNVPGGKRAARIQRQGTQTSITFDEKRVPDFATYVADRLDELYHEFNQTQEIERRD